jgi:hypothetical protein
MQGLLPAREAILKALAYFDLFHYPLTIEEIAQFLPATIEAAAFGESVALLREENTIFFHHGFYSLQNNPLLALRRRQGNLRAAELLAKAEKIGRFLYQFPFVRGVGISGSLSKNYADEKADIDFFIITKANRLFTARTLMHLYKKFMFLRGKQHFYCMNYYVDENALLLEDRNIFTAIEIKTLLPVSGDAATRAFFDSNTWVDQWLPACGYRDQSQHDPRRSWFKQFIEWLFRGRAGNFPENYLFRLTRRRWKQKEATGQRNEKGQPMELVTGKHFARSNPGNFQEKLLSLYQQKLAGLKIFA